VWSKEKGSGEFIGTGVYVLLPAIGAPTSEIESAKVKMNLLELVG
jgi:hypothetical protein